MAQSRSGEIVRHFRTLFNVGRVAGLTDAELLDRFAAGPGEAAEPAFAALLERHGAMVWRVCRRVLRDEHDAEDAFQATFLVLVRRASAIRRRDSVASWLYGVALRVASCARAAAKRRRMLECRKAAGVRFEPEAGPGELGVALHQELGRLPARFQDVAVLCLLEGTSYGEAAERLGCPVGTVKSRLATARQRLQSRLVRRGVVPSTAVCAAALAAEAEAGTPPPPLVESTIRAATRVAAGHAAAAGAVSASVDTLIRGALKAMLLSKLKATVMATVAVGLLGVGVAWPQDSPGPSEPDRLREVERKLDRVLEALGRTPTTATAQVSAPGVSSSSAQQPGESAATKRPPPYATTVVTKDELTKVARPVVSYVPIETAEVQSAASDRLTRVERRLDELERRLEQLEHRAGVADELPRKK